MKLRFARGLIDRVVRLISGLLRGMMPSLPKVAPAFYAFFSQTTFESIFLKSRNFNSYFIVFLKIKLCKNVFILVPHYYCVQ